MATERNLIVETLRAELIGISPVGIIVNDRKGNILLYNDSARRIFGHPESEVVGKLHVSDLYPESEAREIKRKICSHAYGGPGVLLDYETRVLGSQGEEIPILLSGKLLFRGGQEIGTVGFFQDLRERKALEHQLQASEAKFRNIVETASDAVISIDSEHRIIIFNGAAERMFGYGKEEILGQDLALLIPARYGDHKKFVDRYIQTKTAHIVGRQVEFTALRRGGDEFPVSISVSALQQDDTFIFASFIRDITTRKKGEKELELLAATDPLTGLMNRRQLFIIGEKEVARAERRRGTFSLLMIDIDDFKDHNDLYGHLEGDKVLKRLGEVILHNIRHEDSAFRYGGEEFVVLLSGCSAANAYNVAERIRQAFQQERFPVPLQGRQAPVEKTISVGVAEFRPGYTLEDLLRASDVAMYRAKGKGKNQTVIYG